MQLQTDGNWKQRGISVTSSVMYLTTRGFCITILDTGHQDFRRYLSHSLCATRCRHYVNRRSEGVEPQTIKLFHVCRMRKVPIFTFINKMDRASKDPFDLMDELEKVLGIRSCPINWPIGTDGDFKGVFDRLKNEVLIFDAENKDHGASQVKNRKQGGFQIPFSKKNWGIIIIVNLRMISNS